MSLQCGWEVYQKLNITRGARVSYQQFEDVDAGRQDADGLLAAPVPLHLLFHLNMLNRCYDRLDRDRTALYARGEIFVVYAVGKTKVFESKHGLESTLYCVDFDDFVSSKSW